MSKFETDFCTFVSNWNNFRKLKKCEMTLSLPWTGIYHVHGQSN